MKYQISDEYKSLYSIKAPMNRPLLWLGNLYLSIIRPRSDNEVSVKEYRIGVDKGEVRAYLFTPNDLNGDSPILYYIHGGGFVIKAAPYHFTLMREYARKAGIRVLLIDYRLSPKHKYPVPLNDCIKGYEWIISNSEELGIDINKIIVGGDSAGGCLAASLCHYIKDNGLKMPISQVLIYPVLDHRMISGSMKKYRDTPVWNGKLSIKMWEYYVGRQDAFNTYASPLTLEDFSHLPKAYIELAEFDCLHDEGLEYHKRLLESGVESTLNETNGTCHGFELKMRAKTTRKAIEKRLEYIIDATGK